MRLNKFFFSKRSIQPQKKFGFATNPKCNIIFDKFLKAPRGWTNGTEVVVLLASDQALKSPPTNERHEWINEQGDVIDDTLEDEDEEEMGGTMTLNRNELHDLI
jgi:hypothetical protein